MARSAASYILMLDGQRLKDQNMLHKNAMTSEADTSLPTADLYGVFQFKLIEKSYCSNHLCNKKGAAAEHQFWQQPFGIFIQANYAIMAN